MIRLVLLRHGESQWNLQNRFTGWTDVDLTPKGVKEARSAGQILKERGYIFDIAFTSVLTRAIRTLWFVLDEMNLMWIPVFRNWRMNERHYGALQGLNKAETAEKFGEDQVHIWRRSYDIPPPDIGPEDERHPRFDNRYADLDEQDLPASECLKNTVERFLPCWHGLMVPDLQKERKVLVCAHGNSLRALVKYLDNISDEEIIGFNIPTGIPLVYELDDVLRPVRHYYLGDQEEIKTAIQKVEDQAKKTN